MKKAVIYGAVGVAAFLLYKHLSEKTVVSNFMGFDILSKDGTFFARDLSTGILSEPMRDVASVQAWITAQKVMPEIRAMIPGMGDDDDHLLLPPPGRTLSASGQVLGGLGYHFDAYDAAPSQYRRDEFNDLSGVWKSAGKAVRKAAKQTVKALKPITKAAFVTPLRQIGIVRTPQKKVNGSTIEYQDANGNPISKEEYDRQVAAALPSKALDYKGYGIWTYTKPEGGVLYLINYDAVANSCAGQYTTMEEAKAAIDAVSITVNSLPSVNSTPPVIIETYKGYTLWKRPANPGEVTDWYIDYDEGTSARSGSAVYKIKFTGADPVAALAALRNNVDLLPKVEAPTAAAATTGTVSFALAYGGHAISTLTKPDGGVVYLIDVPAGSDGSNITSYPSMEAAKAAIDATNRAAAPSNDREVISIRPPADMQVLPKVEAPTAAASTAGTVSFALAYGGHAISTLTKQGGGVVYLIDVPAGSDGSGFMSFPTLDAAKANIDAANPNTWSTPPAKSTPSSQSSFYTPQQSPGVPAASYEVSTPSSQVAYSPPTQDREVAPSYVPVQEPAPKSNAGLLVGGGLVAATVGLLFMNK